MSITLAFHGGKSGEGRSVLAQNLAVALKAAGCKRVLLLDLDFRGQNEFAVRWNLAAEPTLAHMSERFARFDENTVQGFFPRSRSGVDVAALAATPEASRGVTSQHILRCLNLFQRAYEAVVVDGLREWDPLTLQVLDSSHKILLVCSPDLVGWRHAREDVGRYQELKFPAAKVGLILNRADLNQALQTADIEKMLPDYTLLAEIPFAAQTTAAVNQRQDMISLFPHAPFAKAVHALARRLLQETYEKNPNPAAWVARDEANDSRPREDPRRIKERIHALLQEDEELKAMAADPPRTAQARQELRDQVENTVAGLMAKEAPEWIDRSAREQLVREVVDEALGLGPLEDLIRDPDISEIMVNRPDQIYIERAGRLTLCDKRFLNDKQVMMIIERIVAPLGRRIDESQPFVDARLADGSRVHAIIPPLALKGPALTIRKFTQHRLGIDELIRLGSLSPAMAEFLSACVRGRRNIVISGGTGSGKTTLLNVLAGFIPEHERIVTIEDAAEMNLPQPHVVTLETRPANIEGQGAITIRDLVRNSLRMRPDRIVVGECRGGEALDMLQAMNTGHDGSLTTAHANSPQDVIARLETMVLMSGMDLPVRAIREQIGGAVDLIVQQARMQDGSRKVTQIAELGGLEDGRIVLHDIFVFQPKPSDSGGPVIGTWKTTGHVPAFLSALQAKGIDVDRGLFKNRE